jgi:hypothetical protein
MKSWDMSIALRAQNNQVGIAGASSEVALENM